MLNKSITVLNAYAGILAELTGTVSHSALKDEAAKLVMMGVPAEDVARALFRVENLHNITAS